MSDSRVDSFIEPLQAAITRFVVPLQTTKIVKHDAFDELYQVAQKIAQQLKGSDLAPKVLLNELYVTCQILQREAPYLKKDEAAVRQMAAKLEMVFALILRNETTADRVPGVPRIN